MTKTALIVGGSSGLGLALGELLSKDHQVFVTGRRDPHNEKVKFISLDLASGTLGSALYELIDGLPNIDLMIYAAGFYQEGTMSELNDDDIEKMDLVGLRAPAMLLARILRKQGSLPGFIAITSTSQWTPRLEEPMYTAVKAGLGMLANSVSTDERVGKVLVAGPAGMSTRFWEYHPRDPKVMLDPKWVAQEILNDWAVDFKYKFIRLLREPARVEVVETR
jgi:NAD(P)-dependent dehydrogenase (short-subunit alcohol dehydrogenase family)